MSNLMAAKRKAISKRVRFELFKRDGFTCQYCGMSPPTVTLHIDHITPVAEGGGNDPDNLVTACAACNLGKGAVSLDSVPESLRGKAELIREREEQLIGYQQILTQKRNRVEHESHQVLDVYEQSEDGYTLSDNAMRSVRSFIEQLGVHAVVEAMEIACSRKPGNSRLFKYFCGICWNWIRAGREE